jgi:hypothetical protein
MTLRVQRCAPPYLLPGIQFDCFPDGTERQIRGIGNTLYRPAGTLERTSPPGPM